MVHIWYFIDDICLPPADLTGTCHGISFYGFSIINITPTVSSNAGRFSKGFYLRFSFQLIGTLNISFKSFSNTLVV